MTSSHPSIAHQLGRPVVGRIAQLLGGLCTPRVASRSFKGREKRLFKVRGPSTYAVVPELPPRLSRLSPNVNRQVQELVHIRNPG
jgi:hypothetical protein